jgi:hypothetical protein
MTDEILANWSDDGDDAFTEGIVTWELSLLAASEGAATQRQRKANIHESIVFHTRSVSVARTAHLPLQTTKPAHS